MIEIELKARVSAEEARAVEERLLELCSGQREAIDKRDTYFRLPPPRTYERGDAAADAGGLAAAADADVAADASDASGTTVDDAPRHIRVRRNSDQTCVCTVKERAISADGVERNREVEFAVESHDKARAALELFGFVVDIEKQKVGHAYRYRHLLIEVMKVTGLAGRFVEIEQLAEEGATQTANAAVNNQAALPLWEMLAVLNIARARVEHRRYIDLLRMNATQ